MIVEKSNEVARGIPVRAENISFLLLAKGIHGYKVRRRRESFHDRLKLEIKWKIQGRIHPDHVRAIRGGAANEGRDLLFCVGHKNLPEGEEVLLADTERELPNGVAEQKRQTVFEIPQRVDAEGVDIEAR